MSDVVIRAEGLGKKYTIGHEARSESYTALRDVIARGARNAVRKARDMLHGRAIIEGDLLEEVWALRDVNFEVQRGEVVGIIGRNGAGKSTLLKVLSRITEPSAGRVTIKGRVASLLEVGTGFHPELTGRENISLNGAILGMGRAEIRRKFDEIVAFADVEKFLDTPVKRYSSGMYVRLAFAVAAYLEPEILVVDEVLAVGDAEFQKKCLGKMRDVTKGGRTVIFVSHNMAAVQTLCPTAILLDGGGIKFKGTSTEAATEYLSTHDRASVLVRKPNPGGMPTVTRLTIGEVTCADQTCVYFALEITSSVRKRCSIEIKVLDALGFPVGFASVGLLDPANSLDIDSGCEPIQCRLRLPRLAQGLYRLIVQLAVPMVEFLDSTGDGLSFEVHPEMLAGYARVLEAAWGYGALEIPLEIRRGGSAQQLSHAHEGP